MIFFTIKKTFRFFYGKKKPKKLGLEFWKQKILGFFIDGPNTLFLNEMSFPRKKQRCVLFSNRELRLFPYVIDAGSEVSFSEAVKRPFIFN